LAGLMGWGAPLSANQRHRRDIVTKRQFLDMFRLCVAMKP